MTDQTASHGKKQNGESPSPLDQKQIEKSLLACLADHTGIGLCVISLDSRIIWANRLIRETFGEAAVGSRCHQVFNHLPEACPRCPTKDILVGKNTAPTHEWHGRDINGREIAAQAIMTPFPDASGNIAGFIKVMAPVVDRNATMQVLRENERKYRMLFEKASDAIYLVDNKDKKILDCNRKAAEQTLYSQDELRDMTVMELHPESDLPLLAEKFRDLSSMSTLTNITGLHYKRKDGSTFPVEISATACSYGERQVNLAIVRDATTLRALERERIRVMNLESLGNLAGGIAHDFNNLMMVVYGNIELALLTDKVPPEAREYLLQSQSSIKKARQLSSRLLTFAHGGDGEKKPTSIATVLKNSARLALEKTSQNYRIETEADLAQVMIDRNQIEQAFSQILNNARESMRDQGGIMIRAKNERITETSCLPLPAGDYVTVIFEDQGVGMEETVLHRVFDPYFSTKERNGTRGTGLGLTICHSIIARHGGHIAIESNPGQGTKVTVRLPACSGQTAAVEGKEAKPKIAHRKKILVMDDEAMIGELVGKMLEHLGYEAATATSGQEGVLLYREAAQAGAPFFLVIADLTVPGGMGGIEMFHHIRAINPEAKAIVASGYSDSPVMADCEAHGFAAAIVKPYSLQKLREILADIEKQEK